MGALVLPALYAKNTIFNIESTREILRKYKHLIRWKENASILEIGFGEGGTSRKSLWPILPKDYKEYVASDVSKQMINFAKSGETLPNSEFLELDVGIKNLPTELQERFDHVVSFYTIQYVKNPKQAFKNIYKMLKRNGETFLMFPTRMFADAVFEKFSKHPKWGGYNQEMMMSVYPEKTEENYTRDFREAGFVDIQSYLEDRSFRFENKQSWNDFLLSRNCAISEIPPEELEEYKQEYFEEVGKVFGQADLKEDDTHVFPFRVLVISSQKN